MASANVIFTIKAIGARWHKKQNVIMILCSHSSRDARPSLKLMMERW